MKTAHEIVEVGHCLVSRLLLLNWTELCDKLV